MTEIPEFISRAIVAQGKTTPEEVAEKMSSPQPEPAPEPPYIEPRTSGPRCVFCDGLVDPTKAEVLREVVGWSKQREQGGQNHVWFRKETGNLMCGPCAVRLRYSGNASQETLL